MKKRTRRKLDVHEAAEVLGLNYKTVYRKAHAGEIPSKKLLGKVWFEKPSLLKWLKDSTVDRSQE